ncbi:MAG TPA: alpha/beta hydrolase [Ktedonobacteraceae bacterium]|nr:alpha/beta hydrolase [Ktedonobacteraceae bacterium]
MAEVTHRFIETNGIRMHIAEQGTGPLVLLLHGFPELWYSWEKQMTALAEAGYHAVAPDMRGYGQTDRPTKSEQYTQLHLVGDIIGLLGVPGEQQAVVAGHDWGASVAWNLALLRPDRVRGVIGLSVPYSPRGRASMLTVMRSVLGNGFYMSYFQQPGIAEAEFERDVRTTMRKFLTADISGAAVVPEGKGMLDVMNEPETLPAWLTQQDLDVFTTEFERTGFTGGLNWYRAIDLTWELMAPWHQALVMQPALFMAGESDITVNFPGARNRIANMRATVPNLKRTVLLEDCGHWIGQERPEEVNAAMIEFLQGL